MKKHFKKTLLCLKRKKLKHAKEALKAVLGNIRTDCYDEIPIKDLRGTAENYRIEALALLDAVYWLFSISEELELKAREREACKKTE